MIGVIGVVRIVVADCGCNRKRIQRIRREITGVFNLTLGGVLVWSLFLCGLNLVTGREDKARILASFSVVLQLKESLQTAADCAA